MREPAHLYLHTTGYTHLTGEDTCRLGDFALESAAVARCVLPVRLTIFRVARLASCMYFLSPSRERP